MVMEKSGWTNSDIHKLFRLDASRQTVLNAEERGEIPKADRIARGRNQVRLWRIEHLPQIGEKFGFLKKPTRQEVICIYTAKGGVLKSTLAYSLARILGLNGIKTLVVGLDIQCSITELALPQKQVETLDDLDPDLGLYHVIREGAPLSDVIKRTPLPTLDILPETTGLNVLEKFLRNEPRREYVLQEKIVKPLQGKYDVIIFDNGPSWNQLIENALTAATTVISPIGCDLGTYQALATNLSTLNEFQEAMKLEWENFILVPTLLEKTKLSSQIYGAYLNKYGDKVTHTAIRRAVKGQEALVLRQSAIEYDPTSPLAQDYYEVTEEIWDRITGVEAHGA